jgi:RHS repeat-associated protein
MLRSSTTSYYELDGLGTVTSLSAGAGALAQTYTFDSFGRTTASSGSLANAFQYAGRELDTESSLYYMRSRYFDPATGRFISEDPVDFQGGINFYAYTRNNPGLCRDPTGLAPSNCFVTCLKIYYGLERDAGVILGLTAPIIPKAVTLPGVAQEPPLLRKSFGNYCHAAFGQYAHQRLKMSVPGLLF